jgi:taurine dioxygenase
MSAQEQIEPVPLAPALGAGITGVDLSAPLSDTTVAAIRQAWLDHQVLVFRGQHLTDAQLTAFSRQFGDLDSVPGWEPFSPAGHPEVLIISNVQEDGATIGVLGDGEASWHTDMSYLDRPPPGSLLYSLEVPDIGGDTRFMSMYAALDALPPDLCTAIEGKSLNHDSSHDSAGNLRSNRTAFEDVSGAPGARHPIVHAHPETGRPALFLGRRLHAWVVGETIEASETLLNRIWKHCTRDEFTYRHQWQAGDLLMWDNRCTMHRRDPFDAQARRIMHRTQLKGVDSVEAAA